MVHDLSIDRQYKKWIIELKGKIRTKQIKAAMTVNSELLDLYWELGKAICEKQEKANWGEGLIDQLAKDLSAAFPGVKGFSRANLFFIWKWYRFYNNPIQLTQYTETERFGIVSQLVRQIPWGHNREIIMKCSKVESALFYVREIIKNNWSRNMLVLQIESKLYERQGKAIQNFQTVLPLLRLT